MLVGRFDSWKSDVPPSPRPLLVLTTCASADEAERLAASLVEQRLAACVNTLGPVQSTYRWQGRVERERESLLVIKTTEARLAELEKALQQRSSYEVPEVLAIPVQGGSAAYLGWLADSVAERKE